jgi:uncharacterized protein (DUF697 family)
MSSEAKAKSKTAAAEETTSAEETVAKEHALCVKADTVIRHNVYWAMGAGAIPLQFVDIAALIGVQLKMLKELGDVYGVPFNANAGKSAVTALLAGIGVGAINSGALSSRVMLGLLWNAPVIGNLLSMVMMPAFAAAFTYAVGRVFKRHFVSGGTFLSFNAKAVKTEFAEDFAEAKEKGSATAATAAA